jgi:DNA-binding beta-propeller fold protein YncE/mono/diheme cytochrome c family protein
VAQALPAVVVAVVVPVVVATACEPPQRIAPGVAPQTSALGIAADGETLFVALADRDEVRAVDARTGELRGAVDVVGHPHRLTVLADGRVAVVARHAGAVSVVDPVAGRTDFTVDVGSDPFGVVQMGDDLFVAVAGEGDVARLDLDDAQVVERIVLVDGDPRGLAVSGGRLIVSHFSSGRLSVIDADNGTAGAPVGMQLASRPFFAPNQFDQLTVDPADPAVVVVPHVECNNDPGQFASGGVGFGGEAVVPYYTDGPTGFPAVMPGIGRADVALGVAITDDTQDAAQSQGLAAEPVGPASPVINPLNRTLLEDAAVNAPVAVALADGGAVELIVARGSGNVVVRRAVVGEGEDSILAVVDVGVGADSIVLSPDGATAFVFNAFDQSVTSFAVPRVRTSDSRFAGGGDRAMRFMSGRHAPLVRLTGERFVVAPQELPDVVAHGRALFHAVDDRLTRNGAISCASCHPGGGDDGTTWAFSEGPRQSPPLWGGILGSEPFHWDQTVRDMADISRSTIVGRMGGTGLGKDDMDAIGAWLDTLPAPAPRTTVVVGQAESIVRGRDVYMGLDCHACHGGADLTDNLAHDVGTGTEFTARETADAFATPGLKGLAHSGPYLHDGSAATLRELVDRLVVTGRMVGRRASLTPRTLTEQQKDDLVAYLSSL